MDREVSAECFPPAIGLRMRNCEAKHDEID